MVLIRTRREMMGETRTIRPVLDCVPTPKITDPFEIMAPLNNNSAFFKVWRNGDGSIAKFECREYRGYWAFSAEVGNDGKVTVMRLGDGNDLEKLAEVGNDGKVTVMRLGDGNDLEKLAESEAARLSKLGADAHESLVATMADMPKETIELCQRRLIHTDEVRKMRALQ